MNRYQIAQSKPIYWLKYDYYIFPVVYGCTIQPQSSYDHGTLFTVNARCYEAVPARHAWRVAENNCVAKGGHLAHVYNARQNEAISEVVRTHIGEAAWLGLNKLIKGDPHWVSGSIPLIRIRT